MHGARRAMSALVLALALALLGASALPAAAAEPSVTERIFGDYVADRVIDGHYTAAELGAALDVAEGDEAFSEFATAVQETYDRDILGLSVSSEPPPEVPVDTGGGILALPQPRGPGERDQPPWPFLALTALAGALMVTGAGSSILRRARR